MRFKTLGIFLALLGVSSLCLAQIDGPFEQDPGDGWGGGGGGGPCTIDSCQTTCTGPQGVECCCMYHCPSGNTWKCTQGQYCSNSSGGCLGLSQTGAFLRQLLSQPVTANPFASSTPVASTCRALVPSLQPLAVSFKSWIQGAPEEGPPADPSSRQAPQAVADDHAASSATPAAHPLPPPE
jgi:hypothetical protein